MITGEPPTQPKPIRYSITEHKPHGQNAVVYEVRRSHNKAFTLRIEAHPRALHDTWPLRRAIAEHAGVDPDQVLPQWDRDPQRRLMGRFAPALWLISQEAACPTCDGAGGDHQIGCQP